ncbi:lipocalin [Oleiphilus sp. HI0071]|uniref:lipocalin family protein n=3 Tax=Oleiphilus TaxID=141450 RepID=UPI0007C26CE0|nr:MULTISPECIES: lipocalin family protein [unclassified Oleiphilus]KZY60934.1 lipocalin [Oleiphilus sp. HI0065]KZY82829.1 lipocalin [Oleiphilus sp. HI0071]KZZ04858.1 lipocalin [Oleiphilus sp. HI0073]KZZ50573.1 lipocalin [Oleiphilus sp. HI0122]KZZ79578.1 lipocalin [Oleiphilus sp. HI0133]
MDNSNKILFPILLLMAALLSGCTGIPKNVQPVSDFELDRYLGKWYEIARLDHSFERGLSKVTAEYTLRSDGGVRVLNRGYSLEEQTWNEAEGKAYFVEDSKTGHLKVSFFGPFYASYVIAELDQKNYQHAFITGPDTDYLWLLSRTPEITKDTRAEFLEFAQTKGFATEELIWVAQ